MVDQILLSCPHCKNEFPLTEAVGQQYREMLEEQLRQKFENDQEAAIKSIRAEYENQLEESKQKAKAAQNSELELRKQSAALQEEREEWELEKQRELDTERTAIREKALTQYMETQELKDRENDELIKSLQAKINDLKQRAEQGSQQSQGEAQELVLEDLIRSKFSQDEVTPIPKGVYGADILHKVFDDFGQHCGTIIWESKRTKTWGNDWCDKLKIDQISAKADISIIVSKALPKSINNFGHVDGIWVTEQSYAYGLAVALRSGLIQMGASRRASQNKGEKIDRLYDYLCGATFSHQIELVVKSFQTMKKELDAERNAMTKIWKKREKQIEQVTEGTLEIVGSLQGIIGNQMPEISGLELYALSDGSDELVD